MSDTTVHRPDLSAVPPVLALRLTDEFGWEDRFGADSPATLAAGARRAWSRYVEHVRPGAGHPLLALRRRLQEIDTWIAERRARAGATDDARRSWEAQAATWRYRATSEYGGDARSSPLRLHVQGATGDWLVPGNVLPAPRIAADLRAAAAEGLWQACRLMWAHDASLRAFARGIAELAFAVEPRHLEIVRDEDPA
jgi:hypothetical protein